MASAASKARPATPAKQRLLDAAAKLFAAHGFEGATTREIARKARVNEVTLFRHFQNKEKLQAAVLQQVMDQQTTLFSNQPKAASPTGLRAELLRISQNYLAALKQHLPLIRTLLAEPHPYREREKHVLNNILEPLRNEMLAALETARDAHLLRADIDLNMAVCMLPGMVFTDTLRRAMKPASETPFAADTYLATCLDVFVRGIAADPSTL